MIASISEPLYRIDYSDPGNPRFIYDADGLHHSFSMQCVPADKHEWLASVVATHLKDAHDYAVSKTQKEIRTALHKALML